MVAPRTPPTSAEALAIARKWLRVLGLDRLWSVGVRVNVRAEDCLDAEQRENLAFCDVDAGYFYARIDVNWYRFGSTTSLDLVIAHEIVHIALWRLGTYAEAAGGAKLDRIVQAEIEQAVETISRALVRSGERRRT